MTDAARDHRLIVGFEEANALAALSVAERIGTLVSFYRVGLAMLTGGGLALANELKAEHGKRILLDLKLYDEAGTVEAAVRGLAQFDLDLLTVHGDPAVVRAAVTGAEGRDMRVIATTLLGTPDRASLDADQLRAGDPAEIAAERAAKALAAGADGVLVAAAYVARVRALPEAEGRLVVVPAGDREEARAAAAAGTDHVIVGAPVTAAVDPAAAARKLVAALG